MTASIARVDLLRGRLRPAPEVFRPPYARPSADFRQLCDGCGDCVRACPEQVIELDAQGLAQLRFGDANCSFCEECARACPTGALDIGEAAPWAVVATVRAKCLSLNGIVCRACGEHCEQQAIRFKLMTDGRSLPLIDADLCTGCGSCAVICPNESILMTERAPEEILA